MLISWAAEEADGEAERSISHAGNVASHGGSAGVAWLHIVAGGVPRLTQSLQSWREWGQGRSLQLFSLEHPPSSNMRCVVLW